MLKCITVTEECTELRNACGGEQEEERETKKFQEKDMENRTKL